MRARMYGCVSLINCACAEGRKETKGERKHDLRTRDVVIVVLGRITTIYPEPSDPRLKEVRGVVIVHIVPIGVVLEWDCLPIDSGL